MVFIWPANSGSSAGIPPTPLAVVWSVATLLGECGVDRVGNPGDLFGVVLAQRQALRWSGGIEGAHPLQPSVDIAVTALQTAALIPPGNPSEGQVLYGSGNAPGASCNRRRIAFIVYAIVRNATPN